MGKEVPFLKLKLDSIGAQVKVRSFDVVVESYLGGLYLQHLMFKGKRYLTSNELNREESMV